MKKRISLSLLCLFFTLLCSSYMTPKYSISYDSNFNPIVNIATMGNGARKTITAIEYIVEFVDSNFSPPYNVFVLKNKTIVIQTNQRPGESKAYTLYPNIGRGYKITYVGVIRVRYSDGSVKNY